MSEAIGLVLYARLARQRLEQQANRDLLGERRRTLIASLFEQS